MAEAFHLVEETDGDERRPEYLCPFCAEDFDIVGLCCHIDEEHTVQAKNGSSVNTEPDPLLSSFMYTNAVDPSRDQDNSAIAAMSVAETSNNDFLARSEKQQVGTLSGEDQEEKARRSEFVQGLLMSAFLNDDL
ncbi:hypothetical protein L1987_81374 [Smallanthus sonchifolius]|uniref:Uncharacterized protein n=1 Tax=Smallanthus sonchifolius TaxID=185202 RepID=A0ACB8YPJ0_9ASTR|nr:hypothetical protein L1987_81374 [Smallanthus sonchifolius]